MDRPKTGYLLTPLKDKVEIDFNEWGLGGLMPTPTTLDTDCWNWYTQ
jgi:hypothetical protein